MSNARRRLLFGILLAAGTVLVAIAAKNLPCTAWSNEVRAKLGAFETFDDGARSSIRQLATEIRRCPDIQLYRVIWQSPGPKGYQSTDGYASVLRQSVLYDRKHRVLGWEHDVDSGTSGRAYIVDDEAILKVAERSGSLEAFAEYDQNGRSGK